MEHHGLVINDSESRVSTAWKEIIAIKQTLMELANNTAR